MQRQHIKQTAIFTGAFGIIYVLCMILLIPIGYFIRLKLEINLGYIVNVVALLLAAGFANFATLWVVTDRIWSVTGKVGIPDTRRFVLPERIRTMSALSAGLVATGVDYALFTAAQMIFTGEASDLTPKQFFLLFAIYTTGTYLVVRIPQQMRFMSRRVIERTHLIETLDDLAQNFLELSLGEKDTLLMILQSREKEGVLVTSPGSANDRFWSNLAKEGWAEPVDAALGEKAEKLAPGMFSGWKIAPGGHEFISLVVSRASNTRSSNHNSDLAV